MLSCNMGDLIPVGLTEVLPGDSFRQNTTALVRCAPLLAPPMHPIDVRIHHWFVPNRLVWNDWEDFITGGPTGVDASVFPTITGTGTLGGLRDFLGVPPTVASTISALPVRAYNLIYNEWYRDQDLMAERAFSRSSGPDTTTETGLAFIAWEKDYFTSARPWEVKGPAITIPIAGQAPILGIGILNSETGASPGTNRVVRETKTNPSTVNYPSAQQTSATTPTINVRTTSGTSPRPEIYADLSQAGGITVNQLRQSLAIQRYQEAAARYGSRYTEYLARLGVRSSDARLQRPEYLGGGRQRLSFSEIVQTGPGTVENDTPVGTLRGHGLTAVRSNRYTRFFEEHGFVLTLMSVRPKTIYGNSLPRHFNRRTKFDYWQRELQHIGQQTILNKEVYSAAAQPDGIFGYQDRFDEYRRSESSIAGEFRTLLDYWHFARIFSSQPALNSTFVSCLPAERPFAVTSEDVLQVHVKHDIVARRLLSQTGTSYTF
ncbi:MAG: major capsid protein [Microvirus sp.]|nr:MAG: major capsid protein [Microvirus sp.]